MPSVSEKKRAHKHKNKSLHLSNSYNTETLLCMIHGAGHYYEECKVPKDYVNRYKNHTDSQDFKNLLTNA